VPARILVVDDDTAIRESLRDVLADAGYDVVAAADGRQALGMMTPRPSLMLVDLMMPELDGWELIDELQRTAPLADIPICVLSAMTSHAPPKVSAVLSKPVDLDRLLETVERLLQQPKPR
jgi:two-component system chemotaxis response regulator CheY